MTDRPLVCVVGSLNIDTTYTVRAIPIAGETVLADTRQVSHGGKGANQAAAVAASGGSVAIVTAVGDDDAGAAAAEDLADRGIDISAIAHQSATSTGSAVILVGGDGENLIVVDPGANSTLNPAWVSEHVGRLAPAVLLGQLEIPYTSLLAAAQAAPEATFVLNPAPMPDDPAEVDQLLQLADVLVPNRSELGQLVAGPEPRTLADVDHCAAALAFAGTLVVTLGGDGAVVYDGSRRIARIPAHDVLAVDTSGAGDAFCGGLAHRIAAGESVEMAARGATELAAHSTTYRGARLPQGQISR